MKLDAEQLRQLLGIVNDASAFKDLTGRSFRESLANELALEIEFTEDPNKRDWRTDQRNTPSPGRARGQL